MGHGHQRYLGGEMVLIIDWSDLERSAAFWCEALGYRPDGPAVGQYLDLLPAESAGLQLLPQRVEDPKPAKNRLHLDLRTRGFRWQILADPHGNELCVVEPPAGHWQA